MGACQSGTAEEREERKRSKEVEKLMSKMVEEEQEKVKLLLLGAGESGKSTIFKQMRVLYGAGLTEDELKQVIPVVYMNTIASMKTLIEHVRSMGYETEVSLERINANVFILWMTLRCVRWRYLFDIGRR